MAKKSGNPVLTAPIGPNEVIITSRNYKRFLTPIVDGQPRKMGLKPPAPKKYKLRADIGAVEGSFDIPLIPESEWADRLAEQIKNKAQLSDIRNSGKFGGVMPSTDQNGRGYCLPPGTKVRMADGTHKPIQKMKLSDEVLSAEGNVRTVEQLHVRDFDGELVNVRLWGHSHLRMTPNHRILTKRGYVRADELTAEDYVSIPKYAPQSTRVIQTSQHIIGLKRRVKNIAGKAAFEYRIPNKTDGGTNHLPDFIELNYSTGRIFGLWSAEGHIDDSTASKCVVWSFGTKEKAGLVDELITLLKTEFGADATTEFGPSSDSVTQVILRGAMWCQLFESLCGRLANGKRFHSDLMSGPTDFLKGLFTAHREADGERTVSHHLAMNLFDIANHLGLRPGVLREEPQITEFCKTRQPVWRVSINETPSEKLSCGYDYRVQEDSDYMWRRVRGTEKEAYKGKVYNIGVSVDNSYVAESIGVHNCWAHSSTSAALICRAKDNQPYADLSAYAVACIIKNYRDEGGWGEESLKFIADRGIPSSEFWPQRSVNRSNDKPETWANAAKHKFSPEWMALGGGGSGTMKAQLVTCLLLGIPVVTDLNWWSHSICSIDLVSISPFRTRIWNSWGDSWSENGTGILEGSRAIPDDALAPRVMIASA